MKDAGDRGIQVICVYPVMPAVAGSQKCLCNSGCKCLAPEVTEANVSIERTEGKPIAVLPADVMEVGKIRKSNTASFWND